ncbi:MAG TPA: amidohydrolase family protein [Bryobacteraceae bacterium]|nr:amidohydrolase family protein [Bryobacteraceae bacterium]
MRKRYLLASLLPLLALAQESISIEEYNPKSTLVVPQHTVTRAKFPFIDIHNHQRDVSPARLAQLLKDMDSLNMRILVDSPVNGGAGEWLQKAVTSVRAFNKDRFAVFTNIDFKNVDDPDYIQRITSQLEQDIKAGAVGLKIWKNFGMNEKDSKGARLKVNDPRYDPVWDLCAKYKIPVLIHTADPWGLFQPMDKNNERWLELKMRPNRNRGGEKADPSWETLMFEQHDLFAKHPKTTFINAHMGWMAHDLGALGKLLDTLPNMYVEIGAITSELGRQPRAAREFFTKYQDRVLFGKDAYSVPEYYTYFRVLETADEYFDPIRKYHGIWKLYGMALPDEVLKKLYYKNALKILPGLNPAGFPQ